jgi:cytoskeletal protein CcmA (bactofilin family)
MFKRRKKGGDLTAPPSTPDEPRIETDDVPPLPRLPPLRRGLPLPDPAPAPSPAALGAARPDPNRPDLARRMPDLATPPNQPPRRTPPTSMLPSPVATPKPADTTDGKRLTVGREICLSGEITACEVLVVEGRVEASLSDSRAIEIAEGGFFKGNAEIDNAEIAGRYEGNLTVRDRLLVRATGKVSGSIRYRRLEVELGGEMVGDMQVLSRPTPGQSTDDAAAQ